MTQGCFPSAGSQARFQAQEPGWLKFVYGLLVAASMLLAACAAESDPCVEAKQDAFKRSHPDASWENLVRARERFQQECHP